MENKAGVVATTLGQASGVERPDHKHEAIRSAFDYLDSAIYELESLLDAVDNAPESLKGAKEEVTPFGSLTETLSNSPSQIRDRADQIRSLTENIKQRLF